MSTFISQFSGLPTSAQLRSLVGDLPALNQLPFSRLSPDSYERKYLTTVYDIITRGRAKSSRPGQNTLMLDDVQFSVDISNDKIPLLNSRFVPTKAFIMETLWFLSGSTNVRFLKENGVSIWDDWVEPGTEVFAPAEKYTAQEVLNYLRLKEPKIYTAWNKYKSAEVTGRPTLMEIEKFFNVHYQGKRAVQELPCVKLVDGSIGTGAYGAQWRKWKDLRAVVGTVAQKLVGRGTHAHIGTARFNGSAGTSDLVGAEIDQIADVIKALKTSPDSRRIIVTAWNPPQIPDAILPPCHSFFQFISTVNEETNERELTVKLTQRSADFLIGSVFNIAQYAMLAHMIAQLTDHKATKLVYSPTDCHIYEDQLPLVREQLMREVKDSNGTLWFHNCPTKIEHFTVNTVRIDGYRSEDVHPNIPYPVAV